MKTGFNAKKDKPTQRLRSVYARKAKQIKEEKTEISISHCINCGYSQNNYLERCEKERDYWCAAQQTNMSAKDNNSSCLNIFDHLAGLK